VNSPFHEMAALPAGKECPSSRDLQTVWAFWGNNLLAPPEVVKSTAHSLYRLSHPGSNSQYGSIKFVWKNSYILNKEELLPKCRCVPTGLHAVTSRNAAMFTHTTGKTSRHCKVTHQRHCRLLFSDSVLCLSCPQTTEL